MTVTNGYATTAELRGHLADTGTKLDTTTLERAINASSRAIDRYCKRRFWQDPTVQAKTFRTSSPWEAWVDDISTTTGLIVKTDSSGDATYATTWAAGTFELQPLNAAADFTAYAWWKIVPLAGRFLSVFTTRPTARNPTFWPPPLQITAKWGWSQVPDEVNEACLLKAASLFKRRDAPFGVAGFGEFGVVRIGRSDPDVVDLLAAYRRLEFGA